MPISPQDALRQRLTQLRLKAELSEYQLSLALGQSKGYIQQISSGRALPSMQRFFDLCEFFHVTPAEFFDAENRDPLLTNDLTRIARTLDRERLELLIEIAKIFAARPSETDSPQEDA